MEDTKPLIEIEYDRRHCRVVRRSDNKVLIAAPWSDDTMIETVADTLSKFGAAKEADKVRELKAGCRA